MKRLREAGRTGVLLAVVFTISGAGGAWAVGEITAGDIAKDAVRSKHVKNSGLKGKDIKDGSLRAADFGGELPAGETGPQGPQGPIGPEGPEGEPGTSVFADSIPSGTTVTGFFGHQMPLAAGKFLQFGVSFPVPAPSPPTAVNFAPNSDGEDDPECTGSTADPTAPAGKVCLYPSGLSGTGAISGETGNRHGFLVKIESNGANPDFVGLRGSWAYTAP